MPPHRSSPEHTRAQEYPCDLRACVQGEAPKTKRVGSQPHSQTQPDRENDRRIDIGWSNHKSSQMYATAPPMKKKPCGRTGRVRPAASIVAHVHRTKNTTQTVYAVCSAHMRATNVAPAPRNRKDTLADHGNGMRDFAESDGYTIIESQGGGAAIVRLRAAISSTSVPASLAPRSLRLIIVTPSPTGLHPFGCREPPRLGRTALAGLGVARGGVAKDALMPRRQRSSARP